jgi:DNA-binding SARP family transcriptional activator
VVRFRLLGPLEVRAGQDWNGIGAPKWRSVLAALLINAGQIVSADTLIDEVWGDDPPARAANLISIYVLRLRRVLGDQDGSLLVTRAPGYQLRVTSSDTDALLFETMAREGRRIFDAGDPQAAARHLAEALALWHGQPLADVRPTPLTEAEAERLAELRLGAIELRITAELACGGHGQAVTELRPVLADHPLREGLWLLLMRALDGAGRHAEALEVYGQARSAISGQLGVDPGAELQQLHASLLARDRPGAAAAGPAGAGTTRTRRPAPGSPGPDDGGAGGRPGRRPGVPAQLPADSADFTGRAGQVRNLCGLLAGQGANGDPGAVRVVVVAGAGGLGKTSLAVHAAHQVRGMFPDGQLYVDLLGTSPDPLTAGDALALILRDLGVADQDIPADSSKRAARYRTAVAGRRMLIVLDNARNAAHVRPLLPGTASSAVLVTTRNRMPDLAGGLLVDLSVLNDDEALVLFSKIAGKDRATAEPEATADLLRACAGLPLAIRICAARLATRPDWTIHTMAARLRDEHRRLDELRAGDLSVRATFQVSFAGLTASARPGDLGPARAFCLLGLWPESSFTAAAAAALFGTPEDLAVDALEVLVDARLLESAGPDRYRFHDLLRVYASELAAASLPGDERDAALGRLLDCHASDRAGPHSVDLAGPRRARAGFPAAGHANTTARNSAPDPRVGDRGLLAQSVLLIEPEIMPTLLASAKHPDRGPVRSPAGGGPLEGQEADRGHLDGKLPGVNETGRRTAGNAAAGTPPSDVIPGEVITGGDGPPAADEAFLAMLRTILVTHGIVEREQVAACYDALIRSWPQPAGQEPGAPGTSPRDAARPAAAPVAAIPDAPGYDYLLPEPLTAKTAADFVNALKDLRGWAGNPSFREMARRCGHAAGFSTICTALGKDELPSWDMVRAIVAACGGSEDQERAFASAWRKLRKAQEPGRQQGKQPAQRNLYPIRPLAHNGTVLGVSVPSVLALPPRGFGYGSLVVRGLAGWSEVFDVAGGDVVGRVGV